MAGTKNDEGKARYDLLPWDAIHEVVRVLTKGAEKYDDRNWEQGITYGRVFRAGIQHATDWWQGEDLNSADWGLHHLAHSACCILMLLAYELRGMRDWDDRPKGPVRIPKERLSEMARELKANRDEIYLDNEGGIMRKYPGKIISGVDRLGEEK